MIYDAEKKKALHSIDTTFQIKLLSQSAIHFINQWMIIYLNRQSDIVFYILHSCVSLVIFKTTTQNRLSISIHALNRKSIQQKNCKTTLIS